MSSSAVRPEAATADRPAATSISDSGSREEVAARVDASLVASLAEPQPSGQDPDPERALTALYTRHGTVVYSIAAAMCGPDRALEIATKVFVSLCRRPEAFAPERGSLRSYLTSHAHQLAVTTLRANTPLRPDQEPEGNPRSADERAEALLDRAGGKIRNTPARAARRTPQRDRPGLLRRPHHK